MTTHVSQVTQPRLRINGLLAAWFVALCIIMIPATQARIAIPNSSDCIFGATAVIDSVPTDISNLENVTGGPDGNVAEFCGVSQATITLAEPVPAGETITILVGVGSYNASGLLCGSIWPSSDCSTYLTGDRVMYGNINGTAIAPSGGPGDLEEIVITAGPNGISCIKIKMDIGCMIVDSVYTCACGCELTWSCDHSGPIRVELSPVAVDGVLVPLHSTTTSKESAAAAVADPTKATTAAYFSKTAALQPASIAVKCGDTVFDPSQNAWMQELAKTIANNECFECTLYVYCYKEALYFRTISNNKCTKIITSLYDADGKVVSLLSPLYKELNGLEPTSKLSCEQMTAGSSEPSCEEVTIECSVDPSTVASPVPSLPDNCEGELTVTCVDQYVLTKPIKGAVNCGGTIVRTCTATLTQELLPPSSCQAVPYSDTEGTASVENPTGANACDGDSALLKQSADMVFEFPTPIAPGDSVQVTLAMGKSITTGFSGPSGVGCVVFYAQSGACSLSGGSNIGSWGYNGSTQNALGAGWGTLGPVPGTPANVYETITLVNTTASPMTCLRVWNDKENILLDCICVDSGCQGHATENQLLISANSVSNPANVLGAPDGQVATLCQNNSQISGINLDSTVPAGTLIEITLGPDNTAACLQIKFSTDCTTYTTVAAYGWPTASSPPLPAGAVGFTPSVAVGQLETITIIAPFDVACVNFLEDAGCANVDGISYNNCSTETGICVYTETFVQYIHIEDTESPVITSCPADITVASYCDVPAAALKSVVAQDNCDEKLSIRLSATSLTGDACTGGTVTYTYQVSDDCANVVTCDQVITFGPTGGSDITVTMPPDNGPYCLGTDISTIPSPTASDDNGPLVGSCVVRGYKTSCQITYNRICTFTSGIGGACSGVSGCQDGTVDVSQTTVANPNNGDVIDGTFTDGICLGDKMVIVLPGPVLPGDTFDIVVQSTSDGCVAIYGACDSASLSGTFLGRLGALNSSATYYIPPAQVDQPVTITITNSLASPMSCLYLKNDLGCVAVDGVCYTDPTADCGGGSVTVTQTIVLTDTATPVITSCPAGATVSCLCDVPAADPDSVLFTDDCTTTVNVSVLETVSGDACTGGTVTYTYTVQDGCGNATSCNQVYIFGADAINASEPSLDASYPCDVNLDSIPLPTAASSCNSDITSSIEINQVAGNGACNLAIDRVVTFTMASSSCCPSGGGIGGCLPAQYASGNAVNPTLINACDGQGADVGDFKNIEVTLAQPLQPGECMRITLAIAPTNGCVQIFGRPTCGSSAGQVFYGMWGRRLSGANDTWGDLGPNPSTYVFGTYETITICNDGNVALSCLYIKNDVGNVLVDCVCSESVGCSPATYNTGNAENPANINSCDGQGAGVGDFKNIEVSLSQPLQPGDCVTITLAIAPTNGCVQIFGRPTCGSSSGQTFFGMWGRRLSGANDTWGDLGPNPSTYVFGTYETITICNDGSVPMNCLYIKNDIGMVLVDCVCSGGAPAGICCSQTLVVTQTINLVDNQAPVITCLDDVTQNNCIPLGLQVLPGALTVTDDCDANPTVAFESNTLLGTLCNAADPLRREVVYSATDDCGNVGYCTQTFFAADAEAPVITSCAPDQTVSCPNEITAPNTAAVTASDNCDTSVSIAHISSVTNGTGCPSSPRIVEHIYQAQDDCGNLSAPCTQTITQVDATEPVISCPQGSTLECLCDLPRYSANFVIFQQKAERKAFAPSKGCVRPIWQSSQLPTFSDLCDSSPNLTMFENIIQGAGCAGTGWRLCVPTFTLPSSTVTGVSIGGTPWTPSMGYPVPAAQFHAFCDELQTVVGGTDPYIPISDVHCFYYAGDQITISTADANTGSTGSYTSQSIAGPTVVEQIWTATDDCGNTASCTSTYQIVDTTAPVLTNCPPDRPANNGNCGSLAGIVPDLDLVLGTDNCDASLTAVIVSSNVVGSGCGVNGLRVEFTYVLEDNCGNQSAPCVQSIYLNDTAAPTFACPADRVVNACDANGIVSDPIVVTDDCDPAPTYTVTTNVTGTLCGNPGLAVTFTYVASDSCGNLSSPACVQTITVTDTTLPVIAAVALPTVVLPCGTDIASFAAGISLNITEACGPVTTNLTIVTTTNGCFENSVFTWIATDLCGNASLPVSASITAEANPSDPVLTSDGLNNLSINIGCLEEGDIDAALTATPVPGATATCGTLTACNGAWTLTSNAQCQKNYERIITYHSTCPSDAAHVCGNPDPNQLVVTQSAAVAVLEPIVIANVSNDLGCITAADIPTTLNGVTVPQPSSSGCGSYVACEGTWTQDGGNGTAPDTCVSSYITGAQGTQKSGLPVSAGNSDVTQVFGPVAVNVLSAPYSFYSLGFGGTATFGFTQPVSGSITIYELSNPQNYPLETATIEVSADNVTWVTLGTADNSTIDSADPLLRPSTFALPGCISFIRLTDTTNPSVHSQDADGFCIEAICASTACDSCDETYSRPITYQPTCPGDTFVCGTDTHDGNAVTITQIVSFTVLQPPVVSAPEVDLGCIGEADIDTALANAPMPTVDGSTSCGGLTVCDDLWALTAGSTGCEREYTRSISYIPLCPGETYNCEFGGLNPNAVTVVQTAVVSVLPMPTFTPNNPDLGCLDAGEVIAALDGVALPTVETGNGTCGNYAVCEGTWALIAGDLSTDCQQTFEREILVQPYCDSFDCSTDNPDENAMVFTQSVDITVLQPIEVTGTLNDLGCIGDAVITTTLAGIALPTPTDNGCAGVQACPGDWTINPATVGQCDVEYTRPVSFVPVCPTDAHDCTTDPPPATAVTVIQTGRFSVLQAPVVTAPVVDLGCLSAGSVSTALDGVAMPTATAGACGNIEICDTPWVATAGTTGCELEYTRELTYVPLCAGDTYSCEFGSLNAFAVTLVQTATVTVLAMPTITPNDIDLGCMDASELTGALDGVAGPTVASGNDSCGNYAVCTGAWAIATGSATTDCLQSYEREILIQPYCDSFDCSTDNPDANAMVVTQSVDVTILQPVEVTGTLNDLGCIGDADITTTLAGIALPTPTDNGCVGVQACPGDWTINPATVGQCDVEYTRPVSFVPVCPTDAHDCTTDPLPATAVTVTQTGRFSVLQAPVVTAPVVDLGCLSAGSVSTALDGVAMPTVAAGACGNIEICDTPWVATAGTTGCEFEYTRELTYVPLCAGDTYSCEFGNLNVFAVTLVQTATVSVLAEPIITPNDIDLGCLEDGAIDAALAGVAGPTVTTAAGTCDDVAICTGMWALATDVLATDCVQSYERVIVIQPICTTFDCAVDAPDENAVVVTQTVDVTVLQPVEVSGMTTNLGCIGDANLDAILAGLAAPAVSDAGCANVVACPGDWSEVAPAGGPVVADTCVSGYVNGTQGLTKGGSVVGAANSDVTAVFGAPAVNVAAAPFSFYSLGFGGTATFSFTQPVSGSLTLYELSNPVNYPLETAIVEVSADGVTWTSLGTVDNSVIDPANDLLRPATVALPGCISFVRITDTTDPSIHSADADGYCIEAICASTACVEPVCQTVYERPVVYVPTCDTFDCTVDPVPADAVTIMQTATVTVLQSPVIAGTDTDLGCVTDAELQAAVDAVEVPAAGAGACGNIATCVGNWTETAASTDCEAEFERVILYVPLCEGDSYSCEFGGVAPFSVTITQSVSATVLAMPTVTANDLDLGCLEDGAIDAALAGVAGPIVTTAADTCGDVAICTGAWALATDVLATDCVQTYEREILIQPICVAFDCAVDAPDANAMVVTQTVDITVLQPIEVTPVEIGLGCIGAVDPDTALAGVATPVPSDNGCANVQACAGTWAAVQAAPGACEVEYVRSIVYVPTCDAFSCEFGTPNAASVTIVQTAVVSTLQSPVVVSMTSDLGCLAEAAVQLALDAMVVPDAPADACGTIAACAGPWSETATSTDCDAIYEREIVYIPLCAGDTFSCEFGTPNEFAVTVTQTVTVSILATPVVSVTATNLECMMAADVDAALAAVPTPASGATDCATVAVCDGAWALAPDSAATDCEQVYVRSIVYQPTCVSFDCTADTLDENAVTLVQTAMVTVLMPIEVASVETDLGCLGTDDPATLLATIDAPVPASTVCGSYVACPADWTEVLPGGAAAPDTCVSGFVEGTQGLTKGGDPVGTPNSDVTQVFGAPAVQLITTPYSFYSLGFGGTATFSFTQPVSGPVTIYELSNPVNYPLETAMVEVSVDGITWTTIGTADNTGFDPADDKLRPSVLNFTGCISFIRVTDTTDPAIHSSDADGFCIEAICAATACVEPTCERTFVREITYQPVCPQDTFTCGVDAFDANAVTITETATVTIIVTPTIMSMPADLGCMDVADVDATLATVATPAAVAGSCGTLVTCPGDWAIAAGFTTEDCDVEYVRDILYVPVCEGETFDCADALPAGAVTIVQTAAVSLLQAPEVIGSVTELGCANGDVTAALDAIPAPTPADAGCAEIVTCEGDWTLSPVADACDSTYIRAVIYVPVCDAADYTCGDDLPATAVTVIQTALVDTVGPTIVSCGDALAVDCVSELPGADVSVVVSADDCDAATPTVVILGTNTTPGAGCAASPIIVEYVYAAIDACGNASGPCTQTVTVADTTIPTFTCPADVNVTGCLADLPAAVPGLTGVDTCSEASVVLVGTEGPTGTGCALDPYVVTYVYRAFDACGNASLPCTQTVTVVDNTDPVVVCQSVEINPTCDGSVTLDPDSLIVSATDDCSGTSLFKVLNKTSFSCADLGTNLVTLSVSDACGNSTSCTVEVVVVAPEMGSVTGIAFLDYDPLGPNAGATRDNLYNMAVAADVVLSNITVYLYVNGTIIDSTLTDASGEYSFTNLPSGSGYQVGMEWPENRPECVLPAGLTYDGLLPSVTQDAGPDSMDSDIASPNGDVQEIAPMRFVSLTETFELSACCSTVTRDGGFFCPIGNIDAMAQLEACCGEDVTVTMITRFSAGADGFYLDVIEISNSECGIMTQNVGDVGTLGIIEWNDPEGDGTNNEEWVNFCIFPATGTTTNVSYDILDLYFSGSPTPIGRFDNTATNIIVVNESAPLFVDQPSDLVLGCNDELPAAETLTVSSDCTGLEREVALSSETPVVATCPDVASILRIWSVTNDCGAVSSYTQSITVVDETAPVMVIPADVTVNCDSIPDASDITATDDCAGDMVIEAVDTPVLGECLNDYVIQRVWTASDACDNSISLTQTITVVDTVAPSITAPADFVTECTEIGAGEPLVATDSCSGLTLVNPEADVLVPGDCDSSYTVFRVWNATDDCGNLTSVTQTITAVDNTAPVFTTAAPVDTMVDCEAGAPAGNPLVANDCTGILSAEPVDTIVETDDGCENSYDVLRIWTATDGCGNVASVTQTISVVDAAAPVIASVPADETVECTDVPAAEDLLATDSCSDDLTVTPVDSVTTGDCPHELTIERVWTASDDCGNTSSATQIITVVDTVGPAITDVPADMTVECDEIPVATDLATIDACSGAGIAPVTEIVTTGDCPHELTIVRTWNTTDACGNPAEASQTITVVDTTAPSFTAAPLPDSEVLLACGDELDAYLATVTDLTATDACDDAVVVSSSVTDNGIEGCARSYELTWTATDACGNETNLSQKISVPMPISLDITAAASSTMISEGDSIVITVTISNSSAVDLTNINVTNSLLGQADQTIAFLAAGDVFSYVATVTDIQDSFMNTTVATVAEAGCCSAEDLSMIAVNVDEQLFAVGDYVWYDDNQDGLQDPTEDPVPGVTVNLFTDTNGDGVADPSELLLTTTTLTNGEYSFMNLPAGDYIVQFDYTTVPFGYSPTVADQGTSDANDSDGDTLGYTAVFTLDSANSFVDLAAGDNLDESHDQGIIRDFSIGDTVWYDDNTNGILDVIEGPVSNVVVYLYEDANGDGSPDGPFIDTTTTDSNGDYIFMGLAAGSYVVGFDLTSLPAGFVATTTDAGSDDTVDSDADTTTGYSSTIVLDANSSEIDTATNDLLDDTIDMGIYMPVIPETLYNIGDYVWIDADFDGAQGATEAPVSGVTVFLFTDADGDGVADSATPTDSAVTGSTGEYLFSGYPAGDYIVQFDLSTLPAGYAVTTQDAPGATEGTDSDASIIDGTTAVITLGPANSFIDVANGDVTDESIDLGIVELGSIGNFTFIDENEDGVQDAGDTPRPLVTVTLTDDVTGATMSTLSDANGFYTFTNLYPGSYTVNFTDSANLLLTDDNIGSDETTDSDADRITGDAPVTLGPGEHLKDVDAGFVPEGPSGLVTAFLEVEKTVSLDGTCPGIPAASVNEGTALGFCITVSAGGTTPTGNIEINDAALNFTASIPFLLNGSTTNFYVPHTANQDIVNVVTVDGDAVTIDGVIIPPTGLVDGEEPEMVTATATVTVVEFGTIAGTVYNDMDADGDFADSDGPIAGVTISLLDENGNVIATTTTDSNGDYIFTGLLPGDYTVVEADPNGFVSSTPNEIEVNLSEGEDSTGNDYLDTMPVTIGNFVWNDTNANGIQDAGEAGIEGVTVNLIDASGTVIDTTTTMANGEYTFETMPGTYSVMFEIPAGFQISPVSAGGDTTVDSDADLNGLTGTTGMLESGDVYNDLDLGLWQYASIGDHVWNDLAADATQAGDPTETLGLNGITVSLYQVVNGVATLIDTTVTGPNGTDNGYYIFENLIPGLVYQVDVDTDQLLAAFAGDSIITTQTSYENIVLGSDEFFETADFGVIMQATAIDLSDFTATATETGVSISFTTESENDSLGFKIFRSTSVEGERTAVGEMIFAKNSLNGATYTATDNAALDAGIYLYWLEAIDLQLSGVLYGPAVTVVGAPLAATEPFQVDAPGIYMVGTEFPSITTIRLNGVPVATLPIEGAVVFFVATATDEIQVTSENNPERMANQLALPDVTDAVTEVESTEGKASFAADAGRAYLVNGFGSQPLLLDVQNPAKPVVLNGSAYELPDGSFSYGLKAAAGAIIKASDLR